MTNEEEAGPVTVQIGVCSVCHALFLLSGDRLTSPCHGADPLAVLATLVMGSDGTITGEWGLGAPIGEPDITEEPAPAAEEGQPAPVAEAPRAAVEQEGDMEEFVLATCWGYLHDAGVTELELRTAFQEAGAEPEAAATAVGRLVAVRELLEQLQAAREPVPVAAAPSEAESSPENS